MLRSLQIRNLAIIDRLDLELGPGFTVLTGETGAGKSILLDALGLVMGLRADPALVRSGQDRAEITAEFELGSEHPALAWLGEQSLLDADEPGTCRVRRVVHAEGRTRAFVNDSSVSVGVLRELADFLIEIFGQNESQTLLKPDVQRSIVDAFGGHAETLDACNALYRRWSQLGSEIERLRSAGGRDPAQLDFLRYQVQELESLKLGADEWAELEAEHHRLANAGALLQDGTQVVDQLYNADQCAYDLLSSAIDQLDRLRDIDPAFGESLELIQSAAAQVQEAGSSLRKLIDDIDLDPALLATAEQRLSDVQSLARKHRVQPEQLPERLQQLRTELDDAEHATERLKQAEQDAGLLVGEWKQASEALRAVRQGFAERFSDEVTTRVRRLGMANARFVAAIEPADSARPRLNGDDEIRFDFSANPGQPPRALARVASGGELSRVSLAIQVTGQQLGGVDTMIFDEVDAGISGGVAEIVGQELRALGKQRQVLCVTHLAQVAAQGNAHFGIRKEVDGGQTYTRVALLDDGSRPAELARIMGGVDVSEKTIAVARELLVKAAD